MGKSGVVLLVLALAAGSCSRIEPERSTIVWTRLSSAAGQLEVPSRSPQQTASLVMDVDRDGINDFVIANRLEGPSVVWYRRAAAGWTRYVVDSSVLPIDAGGTFLDIDEDGDLDVVFGGDHTDNHIWWWENPYPEYDPEMAWTRRAIKNSGGNRHHDQLVGDFDGDGTLELVFWNQGAQKLFVAEVPEDPKTTEPWLYTEIFSWGEGRFEGLAKADIDGDGQLDIVGGGRWFKHEAAVGYTPNVIDAEQTFSRVAAGQLVNGGWAEVVFVVGDGVGRLKWYEWTGEKWIGHDLLGKDVVQGHSLQLGDMNGDGHLDIFCAEMRAWARPIKTHPEAHMWAFLGDGTGGFRATELASGVGNHETKMADLDGDGDLDLLIKPYTWDAPRIDVWIQERANKLSLAEWERHVVDEDKPWRSIFISSADIDSDGASDIITGGWWYRNPGNPGHSWDRRTIGSPLRNMAAVFDFDGDSDPDVLGTENKGSEGNAKFVWARNDGGGSFTVLNNITTGQGDFLQGVAINRFQSAERLEVALSWHESERGVQMLTVPDEPDVANWTWRRISSASQDEALSAGDIDRDGLIDLLLGTRWLRNDGKAWEAYTLSSESEQPDRNRLVDINADGLLDAVVGFQAISVSGKLVWYEQPGTATSMWKEHPIAKVVGPMSLDVADMDADGDPDVVVGEHNMKQPASARLLIYENVDGKGDSWARHMVYEGDEHHDGAIVVDIDADGDLDIISIGWSHSRVLLYENKAISG